MSWRFSLSSSPCLEASFDENLFDLDIDDGCHNDGATQQKTLKTRRLPLTPPDVGDIFSQFSSQKDVISTQNFIDNCAKFGSSSRQKDIPSNILGINSWRADSSGSNFHNDSNRKRLKSRDSLFHSPPSLLEMEEDEQDEYLYPEDSPEFFTTQSFGSDRELSSGILDSQGHDIVPRRDVTPALQLETSEYSMTTPNPLLIPAPTPSYADQRGMVKLRSTSEIPEKYRSVFSQFPYFNIVQSRVLDEVFYTDRPMVVCAPTGSGKTVIFELAIIRLLMTSGPDISKTKIVYMAPMKALCSERCADWTAKFAPLGLKCKEVTGDSELEDYFEIRDINIVLTTPEKWDSMTRKWKDNKSIVQSVQLFLVDEVHLLNEEDRGATVEVVISRMKTVQTSMTRGANKPPFKANLRLIAISATIPNVEDIAAWLGTIDHPASSYSMDDSYRPVKLRKVVLGFPMSSNTSEFKFDLSLSYKISGIVQTYSDQKPTLVFCATRKSAQQAASILIKDARFIVNSQHRQRLQRIANSLHDSKLRELVICGVAYHHAGLDTTDRKNIESMFVRGDLPVLFSTSTLAVGVNLPAHLVIIKSTQCYVKGVYTEYSETQILQMIGRAGRPQFDTSATAVILTSSSKKDTYSALLHGTQNIESSLHRHLIEHLNAEIVLNTITDVSVAMEWLKSTFLFIRIQKNPTHYGIAEGLKKEALEQKLQDMCLKNLNALEKSNLVKMDDGFDLKPTETGSLMARYYIAYDSMKEFLDIQGSESLSDMITLISKCKEFSDVKLRVSEKRILNTLNKDKHKATIRFPLNGKIKTTDQKINCLIQAALGCLPVTEFSLNQDVTKIFRSGQRVTRCLMEVLMLKSDFQALQSAIIIAKCMKARLWENSLYVSKQIEKVGTTLSTMMVNAGLTSFKRIEETNPREIELIVNRHPPFGSQIRDAVSSLPKYDVSVEQKGSYTPYRAEIMVTVAMTNHAKRKDSVESKRAHHFCVLLVGDADNKVVYKQRIGDSIFLREGTWSRKIDIRRASKSSELSVNIISQDYVGLDISSSYTPHYSGAYFPAPHAPPPKCPKTVQINTTASVASSIAKAPGKSCNHRCLNKYLCGHDCCKYGIGSKMKDVPRKIEKQPVATSTSTSVKRKYEVNKMDSFLHQLHERTISIPGTPSRLKVLTNSRAVPESSAAIRRSGVSSSMQERFSYSRKARVNNQNECTSQNRPVHTPTRNGDEWDEITLHQDDIVHKGGHDEDMLFDDYNMDEDFDDDLPSLYEFGLSSRPEPLGQETPSTRKAASKETGFSPYFTSSHCTVTNHSEQPSRIPAVVRGSADGPAVLNILNDAKQVRKISHAPPPPTPGWGDFEMSDAHDPRRPLRRADAKKIDCSTSTSQLYSPRENFHLNTRVCRSVWDQNAERHSTEQVTSSGGDMSTSRGYNLAHQMAIVPVVGSQSSCKPRVPSFFSSSSGRVEQEDQDAFSNIFHGVF